MNTDKSRTWPRKGPSLIRLKPSVGLRTHGPERHPKAKPWGRNGLVLFEANHE
jgi:hypothetical protein